MKPTRQFQMRAPNPTNFSLMEGMFWGEVKYKKIT